MVYFANFATSNFCLRGCNAGSLDPNNTEGMFNSAFVACFNWPSWTTTGINNGDSSWAKYLNQCVDPNVNTTFTSASGPGTNLRATTGIRFQGRPFSVNLEAQGTGITAVRFLSPVSSASAFNVNGYENVGLSSRSNFVRVDCTVAYPLVFAAWRIGTSSGALASSTQKTSFFFNSNYGGVNFLNIGKLVATFNLPFPSDIRLKQDIKLVGKSNKGINIYTWNYKNPEKFGYGTYQGVMAQEVPYATIENPDGYLMVDYSKTDVTFKKLYESNLGNRKRQEG